MKIVKFETDTCSMCKRLGSYLDSIGVQYEAVDLINNPEFIEKYNIQSSPTLLKLNDEGKEIKRLVGFQSTADVTEFLKEE